MSGLTLPMLCSLSSHVYNVYKNRIKSIVSCNRIEQLPLLDFILNHSVVPDNAFKWLVGSVRSNVTMISCLIKHRLWMDKKIDAVIETFEKFDLEVQSCNDLDRLLAENSIHLSLYEKHYLFLLLTEQYKKDPVLCSDDDIYDCNKQFPVKNISLNYSPTEILLDEALCKAAYLADHRMVKNIMLAADEHNLHCVFDPTAEPEHKKVLSWLQDNIAKGCRGEEDLGWSMGPDSTKWPSTNLKAYVKTLHCLYEVMY